MWPISQLCQELVVLPVVQILAPGPRRLVIFLLFHKVRAFGDKKEVGREQVGLGMEFPTEASLTSYLKSQGRNIRLMRNNISNMNCNSQNLSICVPGTVLSPMLPATAMKFSYLNWINAFLCSTRNSELKQYTSYFYISSAFLFFLFKVHLNLLYCLTVKLLETFFGNKTGYK